MNPYINPYVFPAFEPFEQFQYVKYLKKNGYITKPNQYETAQRIFNVTCDFFGMTPDEIRHKCRKRKNVEARQTAMWIMKKYTRLSYNDIGKLFGSRDHTTVIHSKDTAKDLMDTDQGYRDRVMAIVYKVFEA